MRIMSLMFVLVLLVGCSKAEDRVIKRMSSNCDGTENNVSEFTLQCIKNANPKSDEEPEDWIYMCKNMAVDTFCKKVSVTVKQHREKHGYWKDIEITM